MCASTKNWGHAETVSTNFNESAICTSSCQVHDNFSKSYRTYQIETEYRNFPSEEPKIVVISNNGPAGQDKDLEFAKTIIILPNIIPS